MGPLSSAMRRGASSGKTASLSCSIRLRLRAAVNKTRRLDVVELRLYRYCTIGRNFITCLVSTYGLGTAAGGTSAALSISIAADACYGMNNNPRQNSKRLAMETRQRYLISRLHNRANVFKIHVLLLDVCSTFAGSMSARCLLDRVNGVYRAT